MTKKANRINQVYIVAPVKLREAILKIEEKCKIKIARDGVLILVNGVEAHALDDLETMINEKDEVVFVPMYHGG
jgi:molybdopterin converting factor small subunit